MNGSAYIAVVELSDKVRGIVATPGQTCEDVNPASLPWLLEQGLIVPVAAQRDEDDN